MLTEHEQSCFIKNAIARLLLGYIQYNKAARVVNIFITVKSPNSRNLQNIVICRWRADQVEGIGK